MPAMVWVWEEIAGEVAEWVPSRGLFVAAIMNEVYIQRYEGRGRSVAV
jgi:hypothetical protein